MTLYDYVDEVIAVFSSAALNHRLVYFSKLWSIFPNGTDRADVYDTLEEACERIAPRDVAIYEALLAKSTTPFPGSGFFDLFLVARPDEWKEIALSDGSREKHPNDLTDEQARKIVARERSRVYHHALTIAALPSPRLMNP